MDDCSSVGPAAGCTADWQPVAERPRSHLGWLWLAVLVAFALRMAALWWNPLEPNTMTTGYLEGVASLASGHGLLMPRLLDDEVRGPANAPAVIAALESREAVGGRVDPEHPYPTSTAEWMGATFHPFGYTLLVYGLYCVGNYSGALFLTQAFQVLLDSSACLLIFVFARNVFGRRAALVAAWIYAVLPSAIIATMPLIPDALAPFFTALVLALASSARAGRGWVLIPTGLAAGLAAQFRPEFMLLLVPILVILLIWRPGVRSTLAWCVGMFAAYFLVMTPWIVWTYQQTGYVRLAAGSVGGAMYEGLGELPDNPWGVTANDEWLARDALAHGFTSALAPDGSEYYLKLWKQAVRERPADYARLVLKTRLPQALVPAFAPQVTAADMKLNLASVMKAEGLSYSQVYKKYPFKVLRYKGPQLVTMAISPVLLLALLGVSLFRWRQWRALLWLFLPWAYTLSTVVLFRAVLSRYLTPILVVETVALAVSIVTLTEWWCRWRGAAGAVPR